MIYEDLMLYKSGYESLTHSIRQDKFVINEKNILIENLKNEIERFKEHARLNICNNRMTRASQFEQFDSSSVYSRAGKFFDRKEAEKHTSEEWLELLNGLDIRMSDIEVLSRNDAFGKFIEGLELLNKIVIDKNMQINLLMQENEKLNHKNSKLESTSVKQNKAIIELKQTVNRLTQEIGEMSNMNTSMGGNVSTIGNDEYIKDKYKYGKNHVQSIQNINEYKKTVIK
jgi:hypothetical protein